MPSGLVNAPAVFQRGMHQIFGFSSYKFNKQNCTFNWNDEQQKVFDQIKTKLTIRTTLAVYNREAATELRMYVSKLGKGGILFQKQTNGELKLVQYFNRATTKEEQFCHLYELETLTVVSSLKNFRVYLLDITFAVITDCNALHSTLTK